MYRGWRRGKTVIGRGRGSQLVPGQILAGRPSGIHRSGRARPGPGWPRLRRARIIALGSAPEDVIAFTSLLAHPDRSPREQIDPAALALLPYSSGTTGLAKGVMLTHRACLTSVVQMLTAAPVARTGRILAVASFFHAVGLVVLAGRALFGGAILVRLPRFEVTGFLAALQDDRITQTVVVPPIVQALAKHPRGPALNGTGMTICPDAAPPAWRRLVRRGRGWSARPTRG